MIMQIENTIKHDLGSDEELPLGESSEAQSHKQEINDDIQGVKDSVAKELGISDPMQIEKDTGDALAAMAEHTIESADEDGVRNSGENEDINESVGAAIIQGDTEQNIGIPIENNPTTQLLRNNREPELVDAIEAVSRLDPDMAIRSALLINEAEQHIDDSSLGASENISDNEFTTDKEKIAQAFSPENLSKLSMDEYVNLLKQYPNYMVVHVTRQGYRDHYSSGNHNAGAGEFQNGFVNLITNGKALKSPMDSRIMNNESPAALLASLGTESDEDKNKVIRHIDQICDPKSSLNNGQWGGGFLDKKALHLSTEVVMNNMYGGETDNEVFMVWPSMTIASSRLHSHSPLDWGEFSGHNDVWVYGKDGSADSLPIDAGVVFLPDSTPVNKDTGSRYDKYINPETPAEGTPEYIEYLIKKSMDQEPQPEITLAADPTTSKQYWEEYFSKHPGLRPAHTVYYNGDPTKAIAQWRKDNGIINTKEDYPGGEFNDELGFPENRVDTDNIDKVWSGVDEFSAEMKKSADEYFASRDLFIN